MIERVNLTWPEEREKLRFLNKGTYLEITGEIFTARDQAHKRLVSLIEAKKSLPMDLSKALLYYCGPTLCPANCVIGACGPTTSSRMDKFLGPLFRNGLFVTMGKGFRTEKAKALIKKYKAVYLMTIGGAGAYLAQFVKSKELVAFSELGPEAIYKLTVVNFPAVVIYSSRDE